MSGSATLNIVYKDHLSTHGGTPKLKKKQATFLFIILIAYRKSVSCCLDKRQWEVMTQNGYGC
jgi:hypothetical protein